MVRRNTQPVEGQSPLFVGGPSTDEYRGGDYHSWRDIEVNPHLASPHIRGDVDAPSVDVEARAYHLREALTDLGKASQRQGFGVAAEIEPHASEIWGRYKAGTPNVVGRATDNIESLISDAKRHFWVATGYAAFRGAKVMPEKEINIRAQQDWNNFLSRFTGSAHRPERDRYKSRLSKQITAQKKLRK